LSEPQNLLALIQAVKPRAALFTTYTFSVGHFDAVFVPALRSVGCQDIAVLLDAEEAAQSAEESRSPAAGRVYRVAPVVAPGGGVFHPKIAYLATDTDDFLAVGSGNLTASGQSLQLESFDAVASSHAPSVFLELAVWMTLLAASIKETSPQASALLLRAAPRARQAHRRGSRSLGSLVNLPPVLVHTLKTPAREVLEELFVSEADSAEAVVVLSPFHSPDGGPLLRLAATVDASMLEVGLDGGRPRLVAPFDKGRFKPSLPGRFVIPDTPRSNKRLHAKVFELRARDKVLVMTGSVNATKQSFESTENVEVSLARWLPKSPFTWRQVEPSAFEPTQEASDFKPGRAVYVDAWLEADRTLRGRLTSRGPLLSHVALLIRSDDVSVYSCEASLNVNGTFAVGPVPDFDTSRATLLTAKVGELAATCWLNVHEELEIAAEERERRSAINRVLRGEYAAEDIAEVIRLLSAVAHGVAANATASPDRAKSSSSEADEVPFSFMRWEASGRQPRGSTVLGRAPYELLKAISRWMNADLATPPLGPLAVAATNSVQAAVQLLGGAEVEHHAQAVSLDPYELLDQLCLAIPTALERQPGMESGGVLAEVAASRAVDRALKQDLKMAPCLSWLDRFSRFVYSPSAKDEVLAVAVAMASTTATRLQREGQDAQLSVLRGAIDRLAGSPLGAEAWRRNCQSGLNRELYRRVPASEHEAILAMAERLSAAPTQDDGLLAFLRRALTEPKQALTASPEAAAFPDVVAALRERKLRRADLIKGLLREGNLSVKGSGCPLCYHQLSPAQVSSLRQRHVIFHKDPRCNHLVFLVDQTGRLERGLRELPDA
jgi:hypothetical protein